jgi:Flp pilus assembly protein TadD
MNRFIPRLMVLFLCSTALAGCADTGSVSPSASSKTAADKAKADVNDITKTPVNDLESGVRQAQLLRQAGQYDEAVHILSQLMLVASDDARVVGEYGKTLAQMGRAQDATQFLTRAVELQGGDWTLYSAMGVAYDQLGDQNAARIAYEHALALNPTEASVLNNYALSRMLANDPVGAHQLIERARIAGGTLDPKIARNIALMNELAPAAATPKPVAIAPQPAAQPQTAVAAAPAVKIGSPRALQPQQEAAQPAPTVVMQPVPVDPLAGPATKAAADSPKPDPVKPHVPAKAIAKADKPVPVIQPTIAVAPKPVLAAAKADKPDLKAAPVVVAATPNPPKADQQPATIVPAVATAAKADKRAADAPAITLAKVEVPVAEIPVITIAPDAKPATAAKSPVKAADAKAKAEVPSLRMASGEY